METKEYHFQKTPHKGNVVKVYMGKENVLYGEVTGMFTRIEHIKATDKKPEYDTVTDCVMLKPISEPGFNMIDYFLDSDRVDFIIK